MGRAPFSGLKRKLCSQYLGKSAFESSHVPVNNRFQALQSLDENICETQGNAPTVLDEVATASAVSTVQKIREKTHKPSNTKNAFFLDEKTNIFSKLTMNDVHVESNIPPVHKNRNVGILSQNTLQTDTPQVATLGDGGTRFQPAPESGQAFDCALPDPTSSSYVRKKKIPLYVWNQKGTCKDYNACIAQNKGTFGYVPLTDLKIYTGPPVKWDIVPHIIEAHNLFRQSGVPNFFKCRIPVETNLNANVWRIYLKDYWDQQLPDLLQFGFPLDFHRDSIITSSHANHTSANQFHTDVQAYINEELAHGAMCGPYNDPPFPVHISPLMTREKQNSAVRRTIVDLSWPKCVCQ